MALTRKQLLKYLKFFVDESERLGSNHELDKYHLDNLKKEYERFLQRVKDTPEVGVDFISQLEALKLNPNKNPRRSLGDKLINMLTIIVAFRWEGMFAREEIRRSDIRGIIIEFRDRVTHLLFSINNYKIPNE